MHLLQLATQTAMRDTTSPLRTPAIFGCLEKLPNRLVLYETDTQIKQHADTPEK